MNIFCINFLFIITYSSRDICRLALRNLRHTLTREFKAPIENDTVTAVRSVRNPLVLSKYRYLRNSHPPTYSVAHCSVQTIDPYLNIDSDMEIIYNFILIKNDIISAMNSIIVSFYYITKSLGIKTTCSNLEILFDLLSKKQTVDPSIYYKKIMSDTPFKTNHTFKDCFSAFFIYLSVEDKYLVDKMLTKYILEKYNSLGCKIINSPYFFYMIDIKNYNRNINESLENTLENDMKPYVGDVIPSIYSTNITSIKTADILWLNIIDDRKNINYDIYKSLCIKFNGEIYDLLGFILKPMYNKYNIYHTYIKQNNIWILISDNNNHRKLKDPINIYGKIESMVYLKRKEA